MIDLYMYNEQSKEQNKPRKTSENDIKVDEKISFVKEINANEIVCSEAEVEEESGQELPEDNTDKTASRYLCEECQYETGNYDIFKSHVENIHKYQGIRFPCSQCDFKSVQKGSLKRHVENIHEKIRRNCEQCSRTFSCVSGLNKHIRTIHEGLGHSCSQCGFKADSPSHLKRHSQGKHEGRKYSCRQCDYRGTPRDVRIHKEQEH